MENLKEEFLKLKENINKTLTEKEYKQELQRLKNKKLIQTLNIFNKNILKSIEEKKDLYKDVFVVKKIETQNALGFTDLEIIFHQMDLDLDYSIVTHLDFEYGDVTVFVKTIPQKGNIFYIFNDEDSFKYAKVDYTNAVTRSRAYIGNGMYSNFSSKIPFKNISESDIIWINSIEELTDSLFVEILNNFK